MESHPTGYVPMNRSDSGAAPYPPCTRRLARFRWPGDGLGVTGFAPRRGRVVVPLDATGSSRWERRAGRPAARDPRDGAVAGVPVRESERILLSFSFAVYTHKRPRSEYSRIRAGPAARTLIPSPIATNGATCATRRGAWVTGFDCGAGSYVPGVIPPTRWTRLNVIDRAGVQAFLLARASLRFPPRSSTCRLSRQPLMSRRANPAAW